MTIQAKQDKQKRIHVIAVRVTDYELEILRKIAYEQSKKNTQVLIESFLEKHDPLRNVSEQKQVV